MVMKISPLLTIGLLLVSSLLSHSEAIEKKKPVRDKTELPITEKTEMPQVTYYSDQKESLKGLQGLGILVEPLDPEIEKAGISRGQLKQEVELKLRQAGIRVLTEKERVKAPGKPYLYVNLNAYNWREEVIYGYSLKIDFNQLILLDRDKNIGCFATTWYGGSAGMIGANKFEYVIRAELVGTLDKFITDYVAVNPK
ncbi:MAG: hypothetical protein C0407_04775 [Desulfobacca sp.]|nr:hypothetical protein [Desulfobacca sp.]